MTNDNEQVVRKPVKPIKDKRRYDRFRDRKDKKIYEDDDIEELNEGD